MHRRDVLAIVAGSLLGPRAVARNTTGSTDLEKWDDTLERALAPLHCPGLAMALVQGDRTVMAAGYGDANVAAGRRADRDTAFYVASVGKVVTATVIMMLWQEGAFTLDEPVGRYLDFPLSHPRYPEVPITFRQLLTHTSGLSDQRLFSLSPSESPAQLRELLISYLTPSGLLYDPDRCFAGRPGTQWSYCNVGYALLGYLVGRVGSDPLDIVSQRRLFAPPGMNNTAWRYVGLKNEHIAERYEWKNEKFAPLPRPAYADWPDGLLITSAADFAQLLRVFTRGGAPILRPHTLASMLRPASVTVDKQDPLVKQALMWEWHSKTAARWATKSGADAGATAFVAFDPARHAAALVFANITPTPDLNAFQEKLVRDLLASAHPA